MPVITLEVLHTESLNEPVLRVNDDQDSDIHEQQRTKEEAEVDDRVPIMSELEEMESRLEAKEDDQDLKVRQDLLEYMMRSDGSVLCKLCGEILQSRPHWYRHKYKAHVIQPPALTPSPLFQCEQCLVFFKSRKGYIGHIASRHSELLEDSHPVLTNTQAEAAGKERLQLLPPSDLQDRPQPVCETKPNIDPELSIPKSMVTNYNSAISNRSTKSNDLKKPLKNTKIDTTKVKIDLEEKRTKEEKLVAEIIDRVRRECEAQQGTGGGPARRGYSRRTTVMHT